jgi:hypothetical protein
MPTAEEWKSFDKTIVKLEVEASDIVKQTYDRYWEYKHKNAKHNN